MVIKPALRRVLIGVGVLVLGAVALVAYALYVESIGVRSPESGDTLSELAWLIWAHQPWVLWLLSHMIAAPIWFLCGHWFAAPKSKYDEIRLRGMSSEKLEAALASARAREKETTR